MACDLIALRLRASVMSHPFFQSLSNSLKTACDSSVRAGELQAQSGVAWGRAIRNFVTYLDLQSAR
jgi:hypothetical protein